MPELSEQEKQLKAAIDSNDLEGVVQMMTSDPTLHRAPLGYGGDGPLTWVAECRVPWEPPSEVRLAMARWMIENGSDIHQGGDGPLMRASLNRDRIAMMELLVSLGADVNAKWHEWFPMLFGPCECLNPVSLQWLLNHGANPNSEPQTALDYLLGTYGRDPDVLVECIELLLAVGARTKCASAPGVLEILRKRTDLLPAQLDVDPGLRDRRFAELDFGTTAARMLTLRGGTLLHVAAEFGNVDAMRLLLDRSADVNARAMIGDGGVGGQTPLFHAATQNDGCGIDAVKLLLERGADVTVRAKVPGHYEREGEVLDCTALEYAKLFPGGDNETTAILEAAASKG